MDDLKELVLSKNPSFEGAVRRRHLPPADRAVIEAAGAEWAKAHGIPRAQAVTMAATAYWELCDEQQKKRK